MISSVKQVQIAVDSYDRNCGRQTNSSFIVHQLIMGPCLLYVCVFEIPSECDPLLVAEQ
jgi:hypothetical protein